MQTFAGLIDIGFGIFHLAFWRLFGWPKRLASSGRLNAAVTQTMNVMLTYLFFVYGGALIFWAMQGQPIHPVVLGAGAGFWTLRFALHFVWFDIRPLAAIVIAALFFLAAVVHGFAALR